MNPFHLNGIQAVVATGIVCWCVAACVVASGLVTVAVAQAVCEAAVLIWSPNYDVKRNGALFLDGLSPEAERAEMAAARKLQEDIQALHGLDE